MTKAARVAWASLRAAGVPFVEGGGPTFDFAGHPLGAPLAVARPETHAHSVALVRWARKNKIPLTPVGARTSFWASTPARGRVVVDFSGLARFVAWDEAERTATAEAGMTVEAFERHLEPRGFWLPACPDGFGDATLASLVANDTSGGHGMYEGAASRFVVGLTAVLGSGETLKVGASSVLSGLPVFARAGVPDLGGALFAAEGALALITQLTLRAAPRPRLRAYEVRFPSGPKAHEAVVAAAQRLRDGGAVHAFVHDSFVGGMDALRLQVSSAFGDEELEAKGARLSAVLRASGLPEPERLSDRPPRWSPAPGPGRGWKAVAISAPYARAAALSGLWRDRLRAEVAAVAALDDGFQRIYFGADGAAALVCWSHAPDPASAAASVAVEGRVREAVAPFGVPYRAGTLWAPLLSGRVDPVYLKLLGAVGRVFDPDGIVNPEVGLCARARRKTKSRGTS